MVCCLQGFPALAVVGVIGKGAVACVVFAREGVPREESYTGGEDGSGEASQPLYKWGGFTVWGRGESQERWLAFGGCPPLVLLVRYGFFMH